MLYLDRALPILAPTIQLSEEPARLGGGGFGQLTTLPLLLRFAARCAGRRIEVAHINVAPRGSTLRKMAFAAVARAWRVPVILHLHGSGYDDFYGALSPTAQHRIRAFFAAAARTVVLSAHWRRFALDQLGLDPGRVVVIGNGVQEPAGAPDQPRGDIPTILFAGEIGVRKGVPVLLDALALLKQNAVPFLAVLAGNGAIAEARRRSQRLGLDSHVSFPGWVDEAQLAALLRSASLFVLPSLAENQPVSIIEAMAHSRPVVSTTVGAIPEQVVDGVTGLLVPPGDPTALAAALARLLACERLRSRFGDAGHARFRAHFTIARQAQQFARLYREVAL